MTYVGGGGAGNRQANQAALEDRVTQRGHLRLVEIGALIEFFAPTLTCRPH